MSSIRQLSRRIKTVQTTSKITGAMQAVAAMRLKKYTEKSKIIQNYGANLKNILTQVIGKFQNASNIPSLKLRDEGKTLMIIISPSRGFCGGLHRQVSLEAYKFLQSLGFNPSDSNEVTFIVVHRPGYRMLSKLGGEIFAYFNGPFKDINPYKILPISELVNQLWADPSRKIKQVFLAYAEPSSSLRANLKVDQILPLPNFKNSEQDKASTLRTQTELDIDTEDFMDEFLPQWLEMNIESALVQTITAEEGARTMAMSQATDNAKRLVEKLKLVYFRQRQAKITQEINEIVGGSF